MTLVQISALLVVLSAFLGWLNHVLVGLPHAIGLLLMGLVGSVALIAADHFLPGFHFADNLQAVIEGIDFFDTVMNGMLAFLLFAAALHVDLASLRSQKAAIFAFATVGVLISTAVVGVGLWLVAGALGVDLPLQWALVFGALISPTDPVAVLSVLKTVKVRESLQAKIAGESLFNDGVGIVTFTVLLAIAVASTGTVGVEGEFIAADGGMKLTAIAEVFVVEVIGAVVLGLAAAAVAMFMIRRANDAALETLISLALVLGTYVLASSLHMSGPIAVVIPGLIIGNLGASSAMSEGTKEHLFPFWTMVDEILNSVLFLLIGLEVLVIRFAPDYALVALACVPLVLLARYASVAIPVTTLSTFGHAFSNGAIRLMTWGGVRGGISVALALSLPENRYKGFILTGTYVVVVFSILVQGLTVAPLARKLSDDGELNGEGSLARD